ncbi:Uncharacterized protein APZ42_013835 [Daphnia magna]|uniref:RNA-directed DNA polymerase n=1 Tax=Daphnia magna TaxID=35525 RepID=A0A162QGL3_9CRUS|nr:Uncharacterized protein APZ42_013835 [Daphnia magna]
MGEIKMVSHSKAFVKAEMADNAALIAALQGFTMAVATDTAARQNQMAQLFQVIGGQQQHHAALQATAAIQPNATLVRPSTVAVYALPHFSGSADEDTQGFFDQVNRVAGLEGWTADNFLLVAVTRLEGTASQWHAQTGQNYGTWPLWSAALFTNFSHTLSFLEWSLMVEARVQKPGESCLEYVLDKRRLYLRSPVPLPEVDIIKALFRGLANPIYIAVLTAQLPVNFTDFVTRLRDLEQLGLSSVQLGIPVPPVTHTAPFTDTACPPPPVVAPPAPNFAAFFQNLAKYPRNSPVVLVRKVKLGEYRFCVDIRRLNAVTKRDVYPLPRIDDVLDRLASAQFFSCLDLASGYWQVPVAVEDKEKTAFITPDGFYQFSRLPFGLNCAPATFQRLIDKTFEEHLARLEILTALEQANLTLNVDKCVFGSTMVSHLGQVIDSEGIRPESEKVRALTTMPVTNLKDALSRNELECLAVVWALKKLRTYIYGRHFIVKTDSSSVKWMMGKKELKGKFSRWVLDLQGFDFTIEHVKGVDNQVGDALSRNPAETIVQTSDSQTGETCCIAVNMPETGLASNEIALLQQQDGQFQPIFVSLSSPIPKNMSQRFLIRGKVLYKKNSYSGRKFLLVFLSILRRKVLESCHDFPSSGHQGVEKTLFRIKSRFWWPRLGRSVKVFVQSCLFCQKHKYAIGHVIGKLLPIEPPSSPFHIIGVDHLGPFKSTSAGYRHIIVAIDYLTKWIEVQPVPDTSSKFATVFLEQNILFQHGTPQCLISNQGTAFTSKLFSDWTSRWNIDHVFSTAEHPETNGPVERVNRILTLAFCAFVNTTHDNWDLHLSAAAFAINTARQTTTEITPFELVHGRLPVLLIENMFPCPDKEKESHSQFLTRIANLRMAAWVRILRKQRRAKEHVDRRRKVDTELLLGDLVLVRRKLHKKNLTKKLLPKFIGPFQVVKKVCPTTYLVEYLPARRKKNSHRWFNAHVCQIHQFHGRSDLEWDESEDITVDESSSSSSSSSDVSSSESENEPPEAPPLITPLPFTRIRRQTRRPAWMRHYHT